MKISLHPRHVYTIEMPISKNDLFERMSKTCYNMEQAKELGLFGIGNMQHAIVLKRDDELFELIKIIPNAYKDPGYEIRGKGTIISPDEGEEVKIRIDYKVIDPGSALGFWVSFLAMCGLLDWSVYKVSNGHYRLQGIDFAFLAPLLLMFLYRWSSARKMRDFNNEIIAILKQPAVNQFPDKNHITAKH